LLDGGTGVRADDRTGFAGALRRLLTAPALRESMGRAARVHAARFSWPATAAAVETELRALTGLPPRAAAVPAADRSAEPSSVEAAG